MVGGSPTALAPVLGESTAPNGATRLSDELEQWLRSDADKTLGGLIDLFEERSFAVLFLFLLGGDRRTRFLTGLMQLVRRLERISRPRLRMAFEHRTSNIVFGALVIAGSLGAFLAVPFTGLDTLPALGVVLVSLAVLLEDFAVAVAGTVVLLAGVALEIIVGWAALEALGQLL